MSEKNVEVEKEIEVVKNIEDKVVKDLLGDGYTACVINRIILELTGDLIASAIMGQIIYMTRIFRPIRKKCEATHPKYIAKTRGWAFYKESKEFREELKLGRKPFDSAIALLKSKNFIETKLFLIGNANSVLHYRITPKFVSALMEKAEDVVERKTGRKNGGKVQQRDKASNVQKGQRIFKASTSEIDNNIPF
jgi:hypothetical protein